MQMEGGSRQVERVDDDYDELTDEGVAVQNR